MAELIPAGSGCEIMGNNGKALSKEETKSYAEDNEYIFLEGKDIVNAWKQWLR
jgi:3,4-dihydroxy 2-butanone 4-phosphate synthase